MAEQTQILTVSGLFNSDKIKQRFTEMLGQKAQGFITSVLQIAANNKQLATADPISVYNAAATAATLDLPINQNLGFAWIIPYAGKVQFQIGYKGLIQLAMRTGQYLRLNAVEVYENQFKSWNSLTEELDADFNIEADGKVVGYCGYFKMVNGFEKTTYWSLNKITIHAKKYSKTFSNGPWQTDFNAMAKKTVLKDILSKWGILSIEMQKAIVVDQAVINNEDATDVTYIDNPENETIEEKSGKVTQATMDALKEAALKK